MPTECIDGSVVCTLQRLLNTCKEGKDRFLAAADIVSDQRLKTLFTQYAHERARFAAELEDEVRRLGGDVKPPQPAEALHLPRWTGTWSSLERYPVDALLSECERGEDLALEKYYRALTTDLPEDSYQLIERQFDAVKQAYDRIYALD